MVCPTGFMATRTLCFGIALLLGACGGDSESDAPDAGLQNTTSPSKRSDIHGAMDPSTGTFAVFGGDDGPIVNQIPKASYRDDTWLFEPGLGWSDVSTAGPSARGRHAVAYDSAAQRMLIFGGRYRPSDVGGDYTLYNDLWAFDFAARSWTQLSDGSGGPAPRYFAAAAFDAESDTFYVYGGGINTSPTILNLATDLWSFKDNTWTKVTVAGAAPDPNRLFIAYTHDTKRNQLIAFGGQVGDFVSAAESDLYALDLGIGVWSKLDAGGAGGPSGRFSSLMTYDSAGDRYLMMGGHADPGVTNDLWAFTPGTGWAQLYAGDTFTGAALGCRTNAQEIPANYVEQDLGGPERRSGGFLGYGAGNAWLFGGESDCSDHLDDTWTFDLESKAWTEVLGATAGESCLRKNNDCECLCN